MITELSHDAACSFLRKQSVARLACVLETGEPYVVPVNYLFRDDSVYVHSLPGHKLKALRANPKACVQTDEIEDDFQWRSVIAFGMFEEIMDKDLRIEILHELFARFQELTPVEARRQAFEKEEVVLFRIRITRVSGVSER